MTMLLGQPEWFEGILSDLEKDLGDSDAWKVKGNLVCHLRGQLDTCLELQDENTLLLIRNGLPHRFPESFDERAHEIFQKVLDMKMGENLQAMRDFIDS
jgi:hypothetical protein